MVTFPYPVTKCVGTTKALNSLAFCLVFDRPAAAVITTIDVAAHGGRRSDGAADRPAGIVVGQGVMVESRQDPKAPDPGQK
jgi:hypothetical protein